MSRIKIVPQRHRPMVSTQMLVLIVDVPCPLALAVPEDFTSEDLRDTSRIHQSVAVPSGVASKVCGLVYGTCKR